MSYCRWGEGDVYMYTSSTGGIECCWCGITPLHFSVQKTNGQHFLDELKKQRSKVWYSKKVVRNFAPKEKMVGGLDRPDPKLYTAQEALNHLNIHKMKGDYVPDMAIERLVEEVAQGVHPVRVPFKKRIK